MIISEHPQVLQEPGCVPDCMPGRTVTVFTVFSHVSLVTFVRTSMVCCDSLDRRSNLWCSFAAGARALRPYYVRTDQI